MAGHERARRHQMRIRMFCCFQMYPPSFSCSDTGWWGMLLFFMLFLMLLLLLLMSMPSDVSLSLETSLTLILQDFLYISSSLETPLTLVLKDFFIHLFVPSDSSCSDTWGWCLGSSACARRCSDTCPLPPSPGLRNILFRGCEISKVSFVSPTWWQMFVLVVVKNQGLSSSGHSDNTWSWITLLLWMFALISSWTWNHQT